VDGHDIWEDWIIKEDEMRKKANWLISKEVPLQNMKLKQMEIAFKKVLDVDMVKEVAVEVLTIVDLGMENNAAEPALNIPLESLEQDDRIPTPTPNPVQTQTLTKTPTPSIDPANPYIRRTGKMTKKEKKELPVKNTKMTAWVRKGVKQVQPVQPVQEPVNGVDMDWEVAPDVDKPWRLLVAQIKTAEYRRVLEVKKMVYGWVSDMVDMVDMVDSIESVSVIGNILEAVIETSCMEGITRSV
jgi:hypothetical protein